MSTLLVRLAEEVFGDAGQVDVVPSEICVHGVIDVAHIVLDVDLLVQGYLALPCEV